MKEFWEARATYSDGTEIEKRFPYTAAGDYRKEAKEQHKYENWLIEAHPGCEWYSVNYVDEVIE